jgi:murein DD-endopeptidase MepM/ murein hydrolase activator NlpD
MTNEAGVGFEQTHPNGARHRPNSAQNKEDFSLIQQHLDYLTTTPASTNLVSTHREPSSSAGYTVLSSFPNVRVAHLNALEQALRQVNDQMQRLLTDQVTPLRLAGHLSVLAVAAVVLILSQVTIPEWELRLEPTPPAQSLGGPASEAGLAGQANLAFDYGGDSLRPNMVWGVVERSPKTNAQESAPATTISYYTVKAGDTVLGIAQRFGLQPETLMWSNDFIEQNPDRLRIGDQVRILPVDGVLHVVRRGDTLSGIASRYKTDMQAIVAFAGNGIKSINDPLPIGKEIIVPGGVKPYVAPAAGAATSTAYSVQRPPGAPAGSGNFSWPAAGYISQGYWRAHPAIDIAGRLGAPVSAADSGFVVTAGGGWNGGYGNHVIIDHGNGFTTLYAHLNSVFVKPGETVSRGQQIGTMGSTGNSTGPHLHFEIRYNGVPYNPANYLK